MRFFLLAVSVTSILLYSCKETPKSPPKQIFNKEFNWKIEIPEGFDTVTAKEWKQMQTDGADAIEKTYDLEVDNHTKTLFVFKADRMNYFESNYQPFDTATDGNYLESFRNVNDIMYGTFKAQMPDAKLDSASSEETVGGKLFQRYNLVITVRGKTIMEFWLYSRLFGNKEFSVNIMTANKEKQKILLRAWRNSTFGKE